MGKRDRGDEDVNKDNYEQQDDDDEPSLPQRADPNRLATRRIAVARRRGAGAGGAGAPYGAKPDKPADTGMGGFGGLTSTQTPAAKPAFGGFGGFGGQKEAAPAPAPAFGGFQGFGKTPAPPTGEMQKEAAPAPKAFGGFAGFNAAAPSALSTATKETNPPAFAGFGTPAPKATPGLAGFGGFNASPKPADKGQETPSTAVPSFGFGTASKPADTPAKTPTEPTIETKKPSVTFGQAGTGADKPFVFGVASQPDAPKANPFAVNGAATKEKEPITNTSVFGTKPPAAAPAPAQDIPTPMDQDKEAPKAPPAKQPEYQPLSSGAAFSSLPPVSSFGSAPKPQPPATTAPPASTVAAPAAGSGFGAPAPPNAWMVSYQTEMTNLNRQLLQYAEQWTSQQTYSDLSAGLQTYLAQRERIIARCRAEAAAAFLPMGAPAQSPQAVTAPTAPAPTPAPATITQSAFALPSKQAAPPAVPTQTAPTAPTTFQFGVSAPKPAPEAPPAKASEPPKADPAPAPAAGSAFKFGVTAPAFTAPPGSDIPPKPFTFGTPPRVDSPVAKATTPDTGSPQPTVSSAFGTSKPTFAFGTGVAPPANKPFTFAPAATEGAPKVPTFTFGQAATPTPAPAPATGGFTGFGGLNKGPVAPGGGFGFGSAPAAGNRFAALSNKGDEEAEGDDGEEDEEEEEEEEKEREKAGEENEENLYSLRSKIYEHDKDVPKGQSPWKEVGIGELRINKYVKGESTGKYRVICRPDSAAGLLLLNTFISASSKPQRSGKNGVVVMVPKVEDGKTVLVTTLIKVKTAEDADKVAAVLIDAVKGVA